MEGTAIKNMLVIKEVALKEEFELTSSGLSRFYLMFGYQCFGGTYGLYIHGRR
jgi:hypothetical protein